MSSLAQYYLEKGHQVSGSDLAPSEITKALTKKGVAFLVGNTAQHIQKDVNLVVYSPAVQKDNPEFLAAQKLGIKLQSYPEALGQLTKKYFTIAVSGSHGKSTTTALVGLVLIKAGLDPTVIVGTKLQALLGSNFRMGYGQSLVIEACEYDSSFDQYFPKITVVTNVDKEHLDYFKTFEKVVLAFKKFIAKLPVDGFLVFNSDDVNLRKISQGKFSSAGYSLRQKESAKVKKIMQIPGQHNVSNALAVLQVARILGVDDATTFASLGEYKGSWRRFEIKEGSANGKNITVVSDYGHHPNEILATLKAAREKYPDKKIWCIFQPHQYQRTYYLFDDFVNVFRQVKIDNIIITDIYDVAGREEKKISSSVNSKNLAKKIAKKNVMYLSLTDAEKLVKKEINSGNTLIIMGAGDIYKLVEKF